MRLKQYGLSFTFLVCGALSLLAQSNTAIQKFAANSQLKHALIGVCIRDIQTGKNIASLNPNQSLTPASILKIVTTASALEILGEDYQFKTTLAVNENDPSQVIVHGYGDPTLGSEYLGDKLFLNNWTTLAKKNLKGANMKILVVDDYFGYDGLSRKWIKEDMGNYYAAGAYGISIFDNSYKLFFNTSNKTAKIVRTEPEMKNILFNNTLGLNTQGKDNGFILGEPFSNQRTLIGDIPSGRTSFFIKGDFPDPGLYLAETFANNLKNSGLVGSTFSTSRTKPQTFKERIFYTQKSPFLKDIIRVINVRSNNHYAEHLIRAIGRAKNSDINSNPLTEGIDNINALWKSKGLDIDALFMYDGCGLTPSNSVSPAFMCDVLANMQTKSKYSEAFMQSFPQAGKDGTVRNFLKGTRLEGKVVVKSGSIANVQCFSGYYINGNEKYAFSVMVNNFNGSHRETVKAIETLLLGIF